MKNKTIPVYEFDCESRFEQAYTCSVPGNNSGTFVQKTDYDEINADFVAMRDAYKFEKDRARNSDRAATRFIGLLMDVADRVGIIRAEDVRKDEVLIKAVREWLSNEE